MLNRTSNAARLLSSDAGAAGSGIAFVTVGKPSTRHRAQNETRHRLVRLTPMSNVFRFPRGEWTDEERDALSRLEEYCADKYVLECNHTDEGDPWCVVFLKGQHEILLHLAKLDNGYVAISPRQHRTVRTRHFADVIRFGLDVLASTAERVG